jgi:hypothetical protein
MQKVMPYVLLHVMLNVLMQEAHLYQAKGNASGTQTGTFGP